MHRSRRNRFWVLAVCAGLAVSQAGTAASQPVVNRAATQLDPFLQGSICGLLESFTAAFAQFPAAAAILASVAQALGCSDAPPPGTTTTIVGGTTTTTTFGGSTTTTFGPTTTSIDFENTSSTTSTTLLPCVPTTTVPGTFPPTTIPCIPPPPT